MREIKKREPLIAILLSAHIPGLGQMYNGQLLKGLLFIFVPAALAIGLFEAGAIRGARGFFLELAGAFAVYAYQALESVFAARRRWYYELKKYNRWYFYVLFAVAFALSIVYVLSPLMGSHVPFEVYRVSSDSMAPALFEDELMLVDMTGYDQASPKRSDIVLFRAQDDAGKVCVKRVLGLPGERFELKLRNIYINDKLYLDLHGRNNSPMPPTPKGLKKESFGPVTIPSGKYFIMGDNRGRSRDSRHFGFIPESAIVGRPLFIIYSLDPRRIGLPLQ